MSKHLPFVLAHQLNLYVLFAKSAKRPWQHSDLPCIPVSVQLPCSLISGVKALGPERLRLAVTIFDAISVNYATKGLPRQRGQTFAPNLP